MWDSFYLPKENEKVSVKKDPREAVPHLMRVPVDIKLARSLSSSLARNSDLHGRLFSEDIGVDVAYICIPKNLQQGQEVALTLEFPRQFFVRAKVRWCKALPRPTGILTRSQQYSYRVRLEFIYDSRSERRSVLEFIREFRKKVRKQQ